MQAMEERTLVDPDFLSHLAADMAKTLLTIETLSLQTAVTKHTKDLSVL